MLLYSPINTLYEGRCGDSVTAESCNQALSCRTCVRASPPPLPGQPSRCCQLCSLAVWGQSSPASSTPRLLKETCSKKNSPGEPLFKCSHRCYSFMAKTIPSLSCSEFYCEYWSCPVWARVLIPPLRYLQSPATVLLRRGAVCHCYLRGCC